MACERRQNPLRLEAAQSEGMARVDYTSTLAVSDQFGSVRNRLNTGANLAMARLAGRETTEGQP
jgi:hypothetical protein